ncbi:MAG: MbnP family protein [Winogradskyella sp.]|uniref:MbnP family protein n=1 Tax=Winogradskyella sp. TaxID=1883156 RepID=UPI00385C7AF6
MKSKILMLSLLALLSFLSCGEDADDNLIPSTQTNLKFTHYWDNTMVTNADFNTLQFTNENEDLLSMERLRYVISDITFTNSANQRFVLDQHHLVDLAIDNSLNFTSETQIPTGSYNLSFTFGLNNETNSENLLDLNTVSFNVPEMLGGGYHYMQFDGKFINANNEEQGFNYHAIRAVDNSGPNPTFPQDTFFTVNLGMVTVTPNAEIEIQMNIAEWFKNPILWDLNEFNQMLMPNSEAQIMMFENGQTVFDLEE